MCELLGGVAGIAFVDLDLVLDKAFVAVVFDRKDVAHDMPLSLAG